MSRWVSMLFCLLMAGVVAAQEPAGFEGGEVSAHIANHRQADDDASLVKADDLGGITVLRVTANNRVAVQHRPWPVEAGKAYEVSFHASWRNEETIETNPSFEAALGLRWLGHVDVLPLASIEFHDSRNASIGSAGFITMLYGKWTDYHIRFVAPRDAASARITWNAGRNLGHLLVTRPAITPLPADGPGVTLSWTPVNAEMSGSFYGISLDRNIRQGSDGQPMLLAAGSVRTWDMDLGGPGKYRIRLEGQFKDKPAPVTLLFKGEKNRQLGSHSIRQPLKEASEFVLPDKTLGVQIVLRDILLKRIHIEPVGDASE